MTEIEFNFTPLVGINAILFVVVFLLTLHMGYSLIVAILFPLLLELVSVVVVIPIIGIFLQYNLMHTVYQILTIHFTIGTEFIFNIYFVLGIIENILIIIMMVFFLKLWSET